MHEPLQSSRPSGRHGWCHTVLLGQELTERAVAAARAVGEDRPAVALEGNLHAVGDESGVEALRGGSPARANEIGGIAESLVTAPQPGIR